MDTKTLLDQISSECELSKNEAASLLETLVDTVASRCAEMDTVTLPGFGSFEPKKRMERVMVMPGTGRRMLMPPKLVLSFKPSAVLKQKLREQ
ncbi:MAG: HU family DNA-binding protein [Muribaculaceae bacterium]|nr:HU family DNA-binding protein [Bacteroidales bacterium]MDE6243918.1 HU family DNA-binding protein [Muribaculaceae bacterium]